MGSHLFIDPVFFFPGHAIPTWDLSSWPGSVELAAFGAVTECLTTPLHDLRLPVIGDDLNRHLAGPEASQALPLECFRIESSVTSGSVYLEKRWNTKERWSNFHMGC